MKYTKLRMTFFVVY